LIFFWAGRDKHTALCKDNTVIENLLELVESWRISLAALNKSKQTLSSYTRAVSLYLEWCHTNGIEDPLLKLSIQKFHADTLAAGTEPNTARLRHYALKSFVTWLRDEGETQADPFQGLGPPQKNDKVVPSLSEDQVNAMITACRKAPTRNKSRFVNIRDEAIFRFMVESATRSAELVAMKLEDINVKTLLAVITKGKGGKGRVVPFSASTAIALDRYLRARAKIVKPGNDKFWITAWGTPMQYHTLVSTLKLKAEAAGVKGFHPHRTRHTAATRWLSHGGSEGGLMAIAGWSSRAMIDRYTGASAAERAITEAKGLNLGLQ
jgi:site-specific recombinase XerD